MRFKKNKEYILYKLAAKTSSPHGIADKGFMCAGETHQLPNGCVVVEATNITSDLENAWFRTSPALNTKKIDGGYRFETHNSVYEITEVKRVSDSNH